MLAKEELLIKIDIMRKYLTDLLKNKNDLLDPEVIIASKMLDDILNSYYQLLNTPRR